MIIIGILIQVFVKVFEKHVEYSVIVWDEIISIADDESTNVTNTGSSIFGNAKVRYKMDCYILYMFLLVTILLFYNCYYLL